MQAIILAAGMGKRLKELTQDNTKCMVKVNGVRLIDRMLSQLAKRGLSRTILVTGYEGSKLQAHVGAEFAGMKIEYIDNPIYNKTNNIYSLALAADYLIQEDTLLLESDLIFEDAILEKIINDPHDNVACVDAYQSWMDGTVVTLDNENEIKRFIPKKDFVYEEIPSYYKTVNVYKFSKDFSTNQYVPFLKAYSTALGNNEYYEQVLRVISLLDKPLIYGLPLTGEKWYEIDDVQDLDIAESMFCAPSEQIKKLGKRFGGHWRYPRLIDFCYLVNPYYPCPRMVAEMKSSFETLLREYPSGMSVNTLLAAKSFGIKPQHIVVGNGAAELIKALMEKAEGKIGFIYPTFEEYPNRIEERRRVVYQPSIENGFRYSAKDLITYFNANPISQLLLVNPDNPSGNCLSEKEIEELVVWCEAQKIMLTIDESFIDFADTPFTCLTEEFLLAHPSVSVMKSISKSYGVPGLRLGVLASGNETLIQQMKKNVAIWNINSFAEFYLQICEKYQSEYKTACQKFREARARFKAKLDEFDFLETYPSEANYFLAKVKAPYTAALLTEELWKNASILIKDCSTKKGFNNESFVRIAVRDDHDNALLIKALKKL